MANEATSGRQLLAVAPFFFVADITRAANYYRDVLGFAFDRFWGEPPCFCMPHRDGLIIMLSQVVDPARVRPNGGDGESWDAYVWVRDADALFAEFAARGAVVAYPPTDRSYYGNREFAVRDPDGYVVAFAHTIAAARPAAG